MNIETLNSNFLTLDDVFDSEKLAGSRATAQDIVHRKISHLLYIGYFRPGETISLRQMSAALGVSEMPVRSALNRLLADNALDVLPNRCFAVPLLSRADFEELMDLRLQLEGEIVRFAYANINRQDIRELERINEAFISARDQANQVQTLEANQRFHFRLYACAKRRMTFSLIRSVWIRAGSVIGLALRSGGAQWNDDYHADIIRGLKIRDEQLCIDALSRDIRHSFELILSHLKPGAFKADV